VFVKNAWYVAAHDVEVTRTLYPTTVLGERVVLYRTDKGDPVVLEDACPHRKLPLSMGRLKGDGIECGYHGLVFDCAGKCVHVPGSAKIPTGAQVRSYPAVSRYGLVWVWMGEAQRADPATIFKVEHYGELGWDRNQGGDMTVACNYLYITDNLLDPSHVAWVHPSSFGDVSCEGEPVKTTVAAEGVTASRWMRDAEIAPFYAPLIPLKGRCDRLQHYEVRFPSHALVKAVFVPAGHGGDGAELRPDAAVMDSYNFMTPLDDGRTRYYWFQMRNFALNDDTASALMDQSVRGAFSEDKVILEAVQQGFKHKTSANIDLAIDRAPLSFRQKLQQLIAAEDTSLAAGNAAALKSIR
jgi:vanillate O-demethylase monooxygenase subunit